MWFICCMCHCFLVSFHNCFRFATIIMGGNIAQQLRLNRATWINNFGCEQGVSGGGAGGAAASPIFGDFCSVWHPLAPPGGPSLFSTCPPNIFLPDTPLISSYLTSLTISSSHFHPRLHLTISEISSLSPHLLYIRCYSEDSWPSLGKTTNSQIILR